LPPAPTLKRKTRITPHLFMHTTTTIPVVAFPVRMVIALRLAIALHHTACPVHKHVLLTTRFGVEPLKKNPKHLIAFSFPTESAQGSQNAGIMQLELQSGIPTCLLMAGVILHDQQTVRKAY